VGTPAVVEGNQITGMCPIHQIPSPSGGPMLGPPMPFKAALSDGLVDSVVIGGHKAAVLGSSGTNSPAHAGLHATDPFAVAKTQIGHITMGSATVLIGGKPAARVASQATCCGTVPGTLVPGVATVLIG
jgi:uncharacterized Zn-binding protein involved in type VI secretion